jgi:5S rRNA maturation endonuclease (ribonuclease M5)
LVVGLVEFSINTEMSVLVEGKNDVKALELAGFTNVSCLNAAVFEVVERFEKGDVVQLCFDDDKKGRELMKRFIHEFSQRGVRIKTDLREEILALGVTKIEDLYSYLKRRI